MGAALGVTFGLRPNDSNRRLIILLGPTTRLGHRYAGRPRREECEQQREADQHERYHNVRGARAETLGGDGCDMGVKDDGQ
jgi:hypothetical protein